MILVRRETSPEDVGGMAVAQGILTATGGKTSHAAVVARGWGKCCVVGCEGLDVDYANKMMSVDGRVVRQGEWITLNGTEGIVYQGEVPLVVPEMPKDYFTILKWADEMRQIGVRANADTAQDARKAREMGAEGVGLCRTEHMFFKDFEQPELSHERQLAIQEMIIADTEEVRRKALDKLRPFQRRDFAGIFREMDGCPVTIRLIDPPLHEFVPHEPEQQKELALKIGVAPEVVARRVEQLYESNPMLGHRGCRLCITYPEILEMQVGAIIEAAIECKKEGIKVIPEIMHPLILDKKELQYLDAATRRVADEIIQKAGVKLHYLVGTMIELPRAALLADQIAEVAEFFSFGTNDLTQTVMGLSRDDAGTISARLPGREQDGDPVGRPVPVARSGRRRHADRVGHQERPLHAQASGDRHLRRAWRRREVGEVLPRRARWITSARRRSAFRSPGWRPRRRPSLRRTGSTRPRPSLIEHIRNHLKY